MMGLEKKIQMQARALVVFIKTKTTIVGTINLDAYSLPIVCLHTFIDIDELSPYNGIVGRSWLNKIDTISNNNYLKVYFPIPGGGVGDIHGDQIMARICAVQAMAYKILKHIKISSLQAKSMLQAMCNKINTTNNLKSISVIREINAHITENLVEATSSTKQQLIKLLESYKYKVCYVVNAKSMHMLNRL